MQMRAIKLMLSAMALGGVACSDVVPESTVGQRAETIVNGTNESGYPAVGSLVRSSGGRRSSFCTGTLIAPNWVITAAHCTKNAQLSSTAFYIGEQATGTGGTGKSYPAAQLIGHPRYDDTNPVALLYDVALVRLREPVPASVAVPYPYNRSDLESAVGRGVTFVGYGVTDGLSNAGGGRKRRTTVNIDRVDQLTYSLKFEGTGVCFGDSGGPGLLELEGQTRVISVVSTGNGCEGDNCNPCSEAGSNHTRVDVFSDWVASVIGDDFPECGDDLTRCDCPSACGEDGVCDDALCGEKSCGEMVRCILDDCQEGADGSCAQACTHRGSPEAQKRLAKFITCWADNCPDLDGAQEQTCLAQRCADLRRQCEAPAGPSSCPEADACGNACAPGDTACVSACRAQATLEAQTQVAALAQCRASQCAGLQGAAARTCLMDKCAAAYAACYPPDYCSPLGGSCPTGLACVPTVNGKTRCEPTAGGSENAPCTRDATPVSCADGLRCVASDKGDVCLPVCSADKACTSGECDLAAYPEDPALGVCPAPMVPPPGQPGPTPPGQPGTPGGSDAGTGATGSAEPDGDADEDAGDGTDTAVDPIAAGPGGGGKGGKKGGGCAVVAHDSQAQAGVWVTALVVCAALVRRRRRRFFA